MLQSCPATCPLSQPPDQSVSPPHREESQQVVDVILTRRAEFSVFTSYISNYDRRMAQLDESCDQRPGFAEIVTQYQVGAVALCVNKDIDGNVICDSSH